MDTSLDTAASLTARLNQLRTEFVDLAFRLEKQRRLDAADVVLQLEARLRDWADELTEPSYEQPIAELSPSRFT